MWSDRKTIEISGGLLTTRNRKSIIHFHLSPHPDQPSPAVVLNWAHHYPSSRLTSQLWQSKTKIMASNWVANTSWICSQHHNASVTIFHTNWETSKKEKRWAAWQCHCMGKKLSGLRFVYISCFSTTKRRPRRPSFAELYLARNAMRPFFTWLDGHVTWMRNKCVSHSLITHTRDVWRV